MSKLLSKLDNNENLKLNVSVTLNSTSGSAYGTKLSFEDVKMPENNLITHKLKSKLKTTKDIKKMVPGIS